MTTEQKIQYIADHYGYEPQSRQLIEEMAEVRDIAISALKEIQQYREIGSVKECKEMASIVKKSERSELANIIDEWIEYRKIGTVEECREALEKQIPKAPIMKSYYEDMPNEEYLCCPTCGDILTDRIPGDNKNFYFHCLNCGQKFDWGEKDD